MLLEENENRNCNCNNANNSCCQKNPTPSVSTYSFNFTNIMPEEFCADTPAHRIVFRSWELKSFQFAAIAYTALIGA